MRLNATRRARVIGGGIGASIGLASGVAAWLVSRQLRIGFENALGLPSGLWLLGPGLVLAPYLAIPSGLIGGAILGPRGLLAPRRGAARLAGLLAIVTALVGLATYASEDQKGIARPSAVIGAGTPPASRMV